MNSRNRPIDFDLYLITDRHQTRGRPLEAVLTEALRAGVRAIQLREKDLPTRELLGWAERLRSLTGQFGARLLINDRVDVCLAVGADGVQLRTDSLPIPVVRKLLGSDRLIGVSTHSVAEAIEAQRDGADFVVLGPVYDTPSKRSMGEPLGLSVLQAAAAQASVPIFAVGGIKMDNIYDVIRSGAQGVALISAILDAENPYETAKNMLQALPKRHSSVSAARA